MMIKTPFKRFRRHIKQASERLQESTGDSKTCRARQESQWQGDYEKSKRINDVNLGRVETSTPSIHSSASDDGQP